jgi:hypothetical protein
MGPTKPLSWAAVDPGKPGWTEHGPPLRTTNRTSSIVDLGKFLPVQCNTVGPLLSTIG